jgi:hypothetical protein
VDSLLVLGHLLQVRVRPVGSSATSPRFKSYIPMPSTAPASGVSSAIGPKSSFVFLFSGIGISAARTGYFYFALS